VIDIFTPLCCGQRIGVFAGSGVGKSTLLAMMSRSGSFNTVVICLVGERGREVRDFLDEILGDHARSAVTVLATSDESPMMRRLAPLTAMTVAEFFRDCGESVLLIMDSVTRAFSQNYPVCWSGRDQETRGSAPLRGFSRFWSTRIIITILLPIAFGARWMVTSSLNAISQNRTDTRRSMFSNPSRDLQIVSGALTSGRLSPSVAP
jgi:hypothetical protein